jgi:hypothetical protein
MKPLLFENPALSEKFFEILFSFRTHLKTAAFNNIDDYTSMLLY